MDSSAIEDGNVDPRRQSPVSLEKVALCQYWGPTPLVGCRNVLKRNRFIMTSKDFKKLLKEASNSPVKETLDDILAEKDSLRFLRFLVNYGNWPARELNVDMQIVPFERQIIVLINSFNLAIDSGGIEQLIADPVLGGVFEKLIFCCREIGDTEGVRYLDRMASYFPQGKVPTDECERIELLEEIKKREQIRNFRFLNKEFDGVAVATIEALRKYILGRSAQFKEELSKPR
jgi:hypothetical protein